MEIKNLLVSSRKCSSYDYIEKCYLFLVNNYGNEDYIFKIMNIMSECDAPTGVFLGFLISQCILNGEDYSIFEKEYGELFASLGLRLADFFSSTDDEKAKKLSSLNDDDVDFFFVILAQRLYELSNIDDFDTEYCKNMASDTYNNLIPQAMKLGLDSVRRKLQDAVFKCLNPEMYFDILSRVGGNLEELENDLNIMQKGISDILSEQGIHFSISSRIKSIYSIYNKMYRGKDFDRIYDILAFRVLVNDEESCNRVIELIHSRFEPLPNRFKDYISNPKNNMYQSLHTTILGYDDKVYEVQVRTYDMHKVACSGSAAYASYEKSKYVNRDGRINFILGE